MKAKALEIKAQNYTTDYVKDINKLYTGCRVEENISSSLIDTMYESPYSLELKALAEVISPNCTLL